METSDRFERYDSERVPRILEESRNPEGIESDTRRKFPRIPTPEYSIVSGELVRPRDDGLIVFLYRVIDKIV